MEKSSVIIVDDNPANLQVLGKTLKKENYQIEFAIDGKTALEWLNNQEFDLILLDVMMPEMDGYEVCKKIRSDSRFNDTPVIFLTAETGKESVLKGFELGAQDYVTKPFDARELLARVKTQLELKNSREQLRMLNQQLEEKVKERTRQLQAANEELSEAHERLSELDKVKTEFLQLISHEIRTPLNGILGPIHLIKERTGDQNLEQLFEILDNSVSRLEKFSYQALIITRLRTKKDKIYKEDHTLKKIIEDSIEKISGELKEKNVHTDINEVPGHIQIKCEYELLKTCLVNILENGVRFSPEKGVITVTAYQKDKKIICEITDQGKGFPKKILNRPFELFSPGESATDSKLGLGLYLSKLIMEVHSGTIEAGNTKQGGASIRLAFHL